MPLSHLGLGLLVSGLITAGLYYLTFYVLFP
jgi:hypothetical protein